LGLLRYPSTHPLPSGCLWGQMWKVEAHVALHKAQELKRRSWGPQPYNTESARAQRGMTDKQTDKLTVQTNHRTSLQLSTILPRYNVKI